MPADGQGQEDLVRGVGDRGQGVGGEDRQRDPLGQQRLAEPVAAQGPSEQQPFGRLRHEDTSGNATASVVACRTGAPTGLGGTARPPPEPSADRGDRRGGSSVHVVDHGLRAGRRRRSPHTLSSRATRSRSSTRTRRRSAGSARDFGGRKVTGIGFDRDRLVEAGIEQARRLRRRQQRRQLQHPRRPGRPRDVRRRQRRRPHLRPASGRGLRAARHPDRRDRALDRRPDAAPARAR